MKMGRFKLAVQTGSTAHFADVSVEVREAAAGDGVESVCCSEDVSRWGAAAQLGAKAAIESLHSRGLLPAPMEVTITKVLGIATDTDGLDASIAAFVAVVRAVLPPDSWPSVRYVGGPNRWEIMPPG